MGGGTSSNRVFLHVDMDAFYASVEQRDHPEYRGKPVVVGCPPDQRGVVATASYEARTFGIHSAMPSREAGQRCPHAIFLPPDMPRYEMVSAQVFEIFGRYTPFVEGLSIDEAFLDVTGSLRLYGPGEEIARRIKADILSELALTCSVGVAPNKFLAKLGSEYRKPDGLTVLPFDPKAIIAFLRPLPVTRLWGVGKVTRQAFDRAALHTIGDVQDAPLALLQGVVGPHNAAHLRALAFGDDPARSNSMSARKSISREHTFLHDERSRASPRQHPLRTRRRRRPPPPRRRTPRQRRPPQDPLEGFRNLHPPAPLPGPTRVEEDLHALARPSSAMSPSSSPSASSASASPASPNTPASSSSTSSTCPSKPAFQKRSARPDRRPDPHQHGPAAIRRARTLTGFPRRGKCQGTPTEWPRPTAIGPDRSASWVRRCARRRSPRRPGDSGRIRR
jgi:nucleotidyltransferase/DNA polymerase involved in DNA repair